MGEKYEILSEKYLRLYLKIVYVVIEVSDTVILYGGERVPIFSQTWKTKCHCFCFMFLAILHILNLFTLHFGTQFKTLKV